MEPRFHFTAGVPSASARVSLVPLQRQVRGAANKSQMFLSDVVNLWLCLPRLLLRNQRKKS